MANQQLWLKWAAVSAVGWLMGLVAAVLMNLSVIRILKFVILLTVSDVHFSALDEVMADNIGDGIPGDFIGTQTALQLGFCFGFLKGAAFGTVGGLAQALVLQRYIFKTRLWIVASMLAWACIWGAVWGSAWAWGWTDTILASETIRYGLLGAVGIGILEWLAIRRQVARAYWWILATVTCWGVSRFFVLALWNRLFTFPLSWLWLLIGIGNGVLTGGMLVWLLQLRKHNTTKASVSECGLIDS